MHGGKIDRYAPDRNRVHQRRPDARRPSSTLSSIPIQRASSSSKSYSDNQHPPNDVAPELDISLPKNFPKPLTCHFWHQNGRCSKRDIDCAYAHYNTGFISGAPVTPLGAFESIAGKNVDKYSKKKQNTTMLLAEIQKREDTVARRESELEKQWSALKRREWEVEDKESAVIRREIEEEEKERIVNRMGMSLARKRKEFKILEKRVARREEALREKRV